MKDEYKDLVEWAVKIVKEDRKQTQIQTIVCEHEYGMLLLNDSGELEYMDN